MCPRALCELTFCCSLRPLGRPLAFVFAAYVLFLGLILVLWALLAFFLVFFVSFLLFFNFYCFLEGFLSYIYFFRVPYVLSALRLRVLRVGVNHFTMLET